MEILNPGMTILLAGTFLFSLVFFFLTSEWTEPKHPERRFQIGFYVTMFYTFLVFFWGILILGLIFILAKFFPSTKEIWKSLFSFSKF